VYNTQRLTGGIRPVDDLLAYFIKWFKGHDSSATLEPYTPMSYLLSISSQIQSIDAAGAGVGDEIVSKYSIVSIPVNNQEQTNLVIPPSTTTIVSLPTLQQVALICVKANAPVDVSFTNFNQVDVWIGIASQYLLWVNPSGLDIDQLKIKTTNAILTPTHVTLTFSAL
jgi:hypothetical protein